jgi:RNA ligase
MVKVEQPVSSDMVRLTKIMKINTKEIEKRIKLGLIRTQKHPTKELFVLNYTEKCQFERSWDEYTVICRGLIVDKSGNILARPFPKFFNLSEHTGESKLPLIPLEEFEVTEKLDGSLGILFWLSEKPQIATRGSFNSEQAIKATEIFNKKYSKVKFDKNKTYLFEIIYPENRIVVNYGDVEDLFLLAVIDTQTGQELPLENIGVPLVKKYDGLSSLDKIKEIQEDNKEGFVIRFKSGMRVKIKMEEYVRLHRLLTCVNTKTIWELLKEGQSFDELLEKVPDEFYEWVKNTKLDLETNYKTIENEAKAYFIDLGDRKINAMYYIKFVYPSILFAMLDKKPYNQIIWKMLKPKAEKPWKEIE